MDLEEKIKKQGEALERIEKDIKKIKKFYFTGLTIKLLFILIPIIGVIVSIPWLIDFYESLTSNIPM